MNNRTKLIHTGHDRDPYTGASSIPIYQVSTFGQKDPEHLGPYDYARSDNPTRESLEHAIAQLEGGARGFAFASGMAATSSVLLLFQPGDHLVVGRDIYGGTYRILTTVFQRWKLDVTFVDSTDPGAVRQAITPATRALFVETPANPLLQITDLRAMVAIAKERGILAITDNTFMTPHLQRPIVLGFDIVVHSATKFLGGHSDVIAGLAVTRDEALGRRLKQIQNGFGAILGPQDSFLVSRGIKTLAVRLDAQQQSAIQIARWLEKRPEIRKVYYPGLDAHPGHEIHARQASGPGAVISFELADGPAAIAFLKRVKLPLVAVSLGGVESILSYPVTMSHASIPREEREARGITDRLVRFSVGLEDPADLIADLDQALASSAMRIGIDLGGTKTEIIALDDSGAEIYRKRVDTNPTSYEAIIANLVHLVTDVESTLGRTGTVGIGIPGTISARTGKVKNANTNVLNGHFLDRDLGTMLHREVRCMNDANCLALSEAVDGAGAGQRVVFAAILGTGCGAGLAVDGQPWQGIDRVAGEWGHNPLPWMTAQEYPGPACWCGKSSCIERWISGTGFADDYARTNPGSARLNSPQIVALARGGDCSARAALEHYANRLARAIAQVINLLDPDVIVLGGGMSNVDELYALVPPQLPAYVFGREVTTPIVRSQHGDSSGVRGAAWLWP